MFKPTIVAKNGKLVAEYPRARVMDAAWHRDAAGIVHDGESVVLLCLLHASPGGGRNSKTMTDLRRIMGDQNL